jgi:hypothetical protein
VTKAKKSKAGKSPGKGRPARQRRVDLDALLCALILAPNTFSRNRFFELFQDPLAAKVRRRAGRVRSMIRQLASEGRGGAEVLGERVLDDGQVLLRYRVEALNLSRSTALSPLEASALRFALSRAGKLQLRPADQRNVKAAFARLEGDLGLSLES